MRFDTVILSFDSVRTIKNFSFKYKFIPLGFKQPPESKNKYEEIFEVNELEKILRLEGSLPSQPKPALRSPHVLSLIG